jgi:hypothetical protein
MFGYAVNTNKITLDENQVWRKELDFHAKGLVFETGQIPTLASAYLIQQF